MFKSKEKEPERPKTKEEEQHEAVVNHFKEKLRKEEAKKREPRSKLNEWAKFVVSQANFMFTVFGLFIVSSAFYLLAADFGDLDKAFFIGVGMIFFLFGWIVLGISYLGCQGIYYQRRVSPYTKWQGTRILSFYQVFLILTFVAELVWLTVSMDAITALKENAQEVLDGNTPTYSSLEAKFAEKFDAFFFGAQSECASLRYAWFWAFVNKRCTKYNSNMSQLLCQRCDDVSVTMCDPDPALCYNSDLTSAYNFACPYNACREGVLEFVIDRLSPFAYFTIFLVVFQVLLIASTCALICFHPRDSDAEIRAKNGIFAKGNDAGGGKGTALARQGSGPPVSHQPMPPPRANGHMPPPAPHAVIAHGGGSGGPLDGGHHTGHGNANGHAPRGTPGSHAPPPRPPPGKSRPSSTASKERASLSAAAHHGHAAPPRPTRGPKRK